MNIDQTIEIFRRGAFDLDCKKIIVQQNRDGGDCIEGPGYIKQGVDSMLEFKLYGVTSDPSRGARLFQRQISGAPGKLHSDESFYNVVAEGHDGSRWTTTRIRPTFNVDMSDGSVIATSKLQSISAETQRQDQRHYLRLHFFEAFGVPVHIFSEIVENGNKHMLRDRSEFEACGVKFEVRRREDLNDTVIEATSDAALPEALHLRIQEALQFVTGKAATWRARAELTDKMLTIELASPWLKPSSAKMGPPISTAAFQLQSRKHGWGLFSDYLAYVLSATNGTYWNPVAYHLHNAREAADTSLDSWATEVSIAVEAVTSLAALPEDEAQRARLTNFQQRMRELVRSQLDLPQDLRRRMEGLIGSMDNPRPQDRLHALANLGHVEKTYIEAWTWLRNRHVHPKLNDLRSPGQTSWQELFDAVHRVQVLLYQLVFHLIGYKGEFTDYGVHGFPLKQYPLPTSGDDSIGEPGAPAACT